MIGLIRRIKPCLMVLRTLLIVTIISNDNDKSVVNFFRASRIFWEVAVKVGDRS